MSERAAGSLSARSYVLRRQDYRRIILSTSSDIFSSGFYRAFVPSPFPLRACAFRGSGRKSRSSRTPLMRAPRKCIPLVKNVSKGGSFSIRLAGLLSTFFLPQRVSFAIYCFPRRGRFSSSFRSRLSICMNAWRNCSPCSFPQGRRTESSRSIL